MVGVLECGGGAKCWEGDWVTVLRPMGVLSWQCSQQYCCCGGVGVCGGGIICWGYVTKGVPQPAKIDVLAFALVNATAELREGVTRVEEGPSVCGGALLDAGVGAGVRVVASWLHPCCVGVSYMQDVLAVTVNDAGAMVALPY
jgi:hypothetical protein